MEKIIKIKRKEGKIKLILIIIFTILVISLILITLKFKIEIVNLLIDSQTQGYINNKYSDRNYPFLFALHITYSHTARNIYQLRLLSYHQLQPCPDILCCRDAL